MSFYFLDKNLNPIYKRFKVYYEIKLDFKMKNKKPNLIIIGAMKSGTTSYNYLNLHPKYI